MQIKEKETVSISSTGSSGRPPGDDVVLADNAGIALGTRPAFSARVRPLHPSGAGLASKCVEIPLVGPDGGITGVLCRPVPGSAVHAALASREREGVMAIAGGGQLAVHDIDNLLAVIGSGLRLLERESDGAGRTAIVGKMQQAISRGARLSRQLLDTARQRADLAGESVSAGGLVALAATLGGALGPDVAVRAEIEPDLRDISVEPVELYFTLLNLCRNSTDAMPAGGTITIAGRNATPSAGVAPRFVEIAVADDGEGMPVQILSQALTPYFTTKAAGTGLGLVQVQCCVEGRGGAVGMESVPGIGTIVRLFLPSAHTAGAQAGTEIAHTPSPDGEGGIFHVVSPAAAALTR